MPSFSYTGYDANGQRCSGTVDAVDRLDGIRRLGTSGTRIVSLDETSVASAPSRKLRLDGGSVDHARLFADLAMLLHAGLPFATALDALVAHTGHPRLREVLDRVTSGSDVADAFADLPGLPPEVEPLLRSGERSGKLASVLDLLSTELAARKERAKALQEALVYPAFLLVLMLAAIAMMTFVLVPSIAPIFEGAEVDPPFVVSLLGGLRGALVHPYAAALTAVVGGLFLLISRKGADVLGRLPLLGTIVRDLSRVRYLRSAALLLGNGVPVTEALQLSANTADVGQRSALYRIGGDVAGGKRLAHAVKESGVFDDRVQALVAVGDEANALPRVLAQAATILDIETKRRIDRCLATLTPMMTIVMGGLVGWLVVSVLTALLSMNELAS